MKPTRRRRSSGPTCGRCTGLSGLRVTPSYGRFWIRSIRRSCARRFRAVHRHLQRHKALEAYQYLDGQYLVSIDGTGQFASSQLSCPDCGVKTRQGQPSYYHQLLGAVFVHPDLKTVVPLAPEAITRQDGATKNDCERNAAKRLLKTVAARSPQAAPHHCRG